MSNQAIDKILNEVKEHRIDYALLAGFSLVIVMLLIYFHGNRFIQLCLFVLFTLSYLLWGIVHHAKENTLHHKVILEYLLIAGCILITLFTFF